MVLFQVMCWTLSRGCILTLQFPLHIPPLGGSRNSLLLPLQGMSTKSVLNVCLKSLFYFCSWRVVFHDLTLPWTRVWRSCGAVLLLGHHLCLCHVHTGGYRNIPGQFAEMLFCGYTVTHIYMLIYNLLILHSVVSHMYVIHLTLLYSICSNWPFVIYFFSEISGPPGSYLSCHRPPWDWQCHAKQHASLRVYLPQPDGCGGFCWSEICQQAGVSFPHLCYYFYCLDLCGGNQIHDSSTRIPVSLQICLGICLYTKLSDTVR